MAATADLSFPAAHRHERRTNQLVPCFPFDTGTAFRIIPAVTHGSEIDQTVADGVKLDVAIATHRRMSHLNQVAVDSFEHREILDMAIAAILSFDGVEDDGFRRIVAI